MLNLYMELLLGKTALKGIGECLRVKSDFPERGLTLFRCFLDLSDPLGYYLGGQLTTNSMNSLRLLGRNLIRRGIRSRRLPQFAFGRSGRSTERGDIG